jgi:hypothetical protein
MFTYLNDPSPKIVSGLRPANLKHDRYQMTVHSYDLRLYPYCATKSAKREEGKKAYWMKNFLVAF